MLWLLQKPAVGTLEDIAWTLPMALSIHLDNAAASTITVST
jgi:hypothetical protein